MQYTILSKEDKVSAKGNKYTKLTLKQPTGEILEGVTAFASFKGDLVVGGVIEGTLKAQDYQGKTTYTIESGNLGTRPSYAKPNIAQAQAVKREDIKNAQANKEEGIMLSSTIRMATDVVIAKGIEGKNDFEIEQAIEAWRKHFISIWNPNVE